MKAMNSRNTPNQIVTRRLLTCVMLVLSFCILAHAQGGYYVNRTILYPDATVTTDPVPLRISPNREDVAAIGMGKTQIANGRFLNGMMYNPALLSHERVKIEIPKLQAGVPTQSIGAVTFLGDNIDQLKSGTYLKRITDGITNLQTAVTLDQVLAAFKEIQEGLQFPKDLQNAVGGTFDQPRAHGVEAVPGIQMQIGNWGFSLYGLSQTGFQLQSSQALSRLASMNIPATAAELTPGFLIDLLTTVAPLFDENGNLRSDALPEMYAMSYLDIVGTIGYAHEFSEYFSLGTNVKVINRRFSTKRISVDSYRSIWGEARTDFDHSITGATLDVGALLKVSDTGLEAGLTVQNLIPLKNVSSTASVPLFLSGIVDYERDQFGNPIVTNGDTALVAAQQHVVVEVPYVLEAPLVASVGLVQHVGENWDLAFDWVDLASQDNRYEQTLDRIRLGTEYRVDIGRDALVLAFRGGMADRRPVFGLGLDFFNIVVVDAAYAHDTFVGEPAYYGQVTFAW